MSIRDAAARTVGSAIWLLERLYCAIEGHEWGQIFHGRYCIRCNREEPLVTPAQHAARCLEAAVRTGCSKSGIQKLVRRAG